MLRGMRYHPTDIENTVIRCHPKICEWLALFVLLVVIVHCMFTSLTTARHKKELAILHFCLHVSEITFSALTL